MNGLAGDARYRALGGRPQVLERLNQSAVFTCIFKLWNRERFVTVVAVFTENTKKTVQLTLKIQGNSVGERLRVKYETKIFNFAINFIRGPV